MMLLFFIDSDQNFFFLVEDPVSQEIGFRYFYEKKMMIFFFLTEPNRTV
jgi:hypothetical protein